MSESRSLTVAERLSAIPAFTLSEQECMDALSGSVYPGAKPQSVKLAVAYCKANVLDPFQKPVHIVPMRVKTGKQNHWGDDEYEQRDVIMPGSGLYRTQAARTGEYLGISEPVFGPLEKLTYKTFRWVDTGEKKPDGKPKNAKQWYDDTIEYPEWCKVTVKRLVAGHIAEFVAVEYWLENYATIGDSNAPNSMWAKRPRGQLAKCAEAQALRKAFPEVGAAPTAEEMEGKSLDPADIASINPEVVTERARPQSKAEAAKANAIDVDPKTGDVTQPQQPQPAANGNGHAKDAEAESTPASAGMLRLIRAKATAASIAEPDLCKRFSLAALDGISLDMGNKILASLAGP